MRIYLVVVVVVTAICWTLEGFTNWSWPIGTTGTAIAALGLGIPACRWFIRHKPTLSADQFKAKHIDHQVERYRDGQIIG